MHVKTRKLHSQIVRILIFSKPEAVHEEPLCVKFQVLQSVNKQNLYSRWIQNEQPMISASVTVIPKNDDHVQRNLTIPIRLAGQASNRIWSCGPGQLWNTSQRQTQKIVEVCNLSKADVISILKPLLVSQCKPKFFDIRNQLSKRSYQISNHRIP